MGILDYLILAVITAGLLAAVRFLQKHGSGCGGCAGDCANCGKKK